MIIRVNKTVDVVESFTGAALDNDNSELIDWANDVRDQLRTSALSMIRTNRNFVKNINSKIRTKENVAQVGFSFLRHGIFLHYGAGRGYGGRHGSKWYDSDGNVKTTRRSSLNKMGKGKRQPINWFNPVIDRNIGRLADIVSENYVDKKINSLTLRIK